MSDCVEPLTDQQQIDAIKEVIKNITWESNFRKCKLKLNISGRVIEIKTWDRGKTFSFDNGKTFEK